jgi:hypothetical protein
MYIKMMDVPVPGLRKYWTQTLASLNFQCHAITNKYTEAGTVVQVHKVPNDIEIYARCTPTKMGESSEWMTIVNSAEENRANFCKSVDGKLIFSALCGMYLCTFLLLVKAKIFLFTTVTRLALGPSCLLSSANWE